MPISKARRVVVAMTVVVAVRPSHVMSMIVASASPATPVAAVLRRNVFGSGTDCSFQRRRPWAATSDQEAAGKPEQTVIAPTSACSARRTRTAITAQATRIPKPISDGGALQAGRQHALDEAGRGDAGGDQGACEHRPIDRPSTGAAAVTSQTARAGRRKP